MKPWETRNCGEDQGNGLSSPRAGLTKHPSLCSGSRMTQSLCDHVGEPLTVLLDVFRPWAASHMGVSTG